MIYLKKLYLSKIGHSPSKTRLQVAANAFCFFLCISLLTIPIFPLLTSTYVLLLSIVIGTQPRQKPAIP